VASRTADARPEPRVVALTVTPSPLPIYRTGTVNLTGGPISSPVTFAITTPGHGTTRINATTDGTGAAAVTFVASTSGPSTVTVTSTTTTTVGTLNHVMSGS
jgi:hypothetical protein